MAVFSFVTKKQRKRDSFATGACYKNTVKINNYKKISLRLKCDLFEIIMQRLCVMKKLEINASIVDINK